MKILMKKSSLPINIFAKQSKPYSQVSQLQGIKKYVHKNGKIGNLGNLDKIPKVLNNFFSNIVKKLFNTFAISYSYFISCHFYVYICLSFATDLPESKAVTVLRKILLVTRFFSSTFS